MPSGVNARHCRFSTSDDAFVERAQDDHPGSFAAEIES
jgi:hypothetical protein